MKGWADGSLCFMRIAVGACLTIMFIVFDDFELGLAREPVNPLMRVHAITIDPTALNPPTWWHVAGVTPLIWTKDPMTYEAPRTTESRDVLLKPGEYRFGTFTFDFAFRVTLEGTLEFSSSLTQCVDGQGTNRLVIRCTHTQPYKQERDYHYAP